MEQWVRLSNEPRSALRAYGLGVLGVITGAVDPAPVWRWRPGSHPPEAGGADWLAERAWLDGVLAHAAGDTSGINRALRAQSTSSAHHADLLVPSLQALVEDARGHRTHAARALLALELSASERGHHQEAAQHHPYLAAVHRPLAARWLLEAGDTAEAFRLLPWHEAILADGSRSTGRAAANRVVEPLALFERARIEEAWGWRERAVDHYRELLERYDRPPARHAPMVEESRSALRRIVINGDRNVEERSPPGRRRP
jgi:hypothetical protein